MERYVGDTDGFLPKEFFPAHDLCFLVHDVMGEFLASGEQNNIFTGKVDFLDDADRSCYEASDDIFEWLEKSGRLTERANILKAVVLPAVLSDLLHFIYEALQCSRKAKLNVTYALIRKPIQESLYLLESIVLDEAGFADQLATSPLKLRPKTAGGLQGHSERIQRVLEIIQMERVFDAGYLAQLRYAKVEDSFDSICNKAMHLFTEHQAIQTEQLNINFVFSGLEAKLSQWRYLYSRLPYVLVYLWQVLEHIGDSLTITVPEYMVDMQRRVAAFVVIAAPRVVEMSQPLEKFAVMHEAWLIRHCADRGIRRPRLRDLKRMALTGALPGETDDDLERRREHFDVTKIYPK